MFNPRPECTRYNDNTPKRDIHLADRALASTQNINIQQMQKQNQDFIKKTDIITSAPPTFTIGEKSHSISHPNFLDRGGVNTRIQKNVNNQQTNNYYQIGRAGNRNVIIDESSTMMDLTRPIDTRLQYSGKRQQFDQNERVPMSKAMPKKF